MKSLVIFMHIPKTGGTTLANILEKQYPQGQVLRVPFGNLHTLKQQLKGSKPAAVHGHHPFGLHELYQGSFHYITMLRDPVDRIISNYYYAAENPGNPMHRKLNQLSFEEFIMSKDEKLQYRISNMQTSFAAGKRTPAIANVDDLELAMENLQRHFSVIGITDMFTESIEVMKKVLGWQDVSFQPKNRTKKRPAIEEIKPEILESIQEKNQLDYKLYNWAKNYLRKNLEVD